MTLFAGFRARSDDAEQRKLTMWGDWTPVRTNASGVAVDEKTALNFSAVWACQTLIADAIATQPVDVFRRVIGTDERVEVPAPRWITQPNPDTDQVEYDTQRIMSLLGWGNCYELVLGSGNVIDERHVLDPSRVTVERVDGQTVYRVDGQQVRERIAHTRGYLLPGALVGLSPVQAALQSVGLGIAAETFNASFFGNSAVPSGVFEVPEMPVETSSAVVERIREGIAKVHAGPKNSWRAMVLTGGTKWTQTMVNPEDAQLLESRRFQVAEIARWYRVPPHLISDVERSTSWGTGIEQQSIAFVQHTLTPWTVRLERTDSALLQRPRFVKRNMSALLRGDTNTRMKAYLAGHGRWLTDNEIRALEDLPPLPGLDTIAAGQGQPNFGDDGGTSGDEPEG